MDPEPPDTYGEYLIKYPRLPLRITPHEPPRLPVPPVLDMGQILVFVNDAIYSDIQTRLDRHILDIQEQGYNILMFLWTSGTVEDLKTLIQTHSTNLVGCVLVGELPCAWYEIENDFASYYTGNGVGGYGYGYRSFPCDLFLMDLDGEWRDDETTAPMQTGLYDAHVAGTGDVGPEIFVGRIDASKITDDTEENLLNNYFDKLHLFYTGAMTQTDFALTYTEDDWSSSPSFWNDIDNAYPDNENIEAPATDRDDYQDNRLDSPTYEFIQLACHSGPTGHSFTIGGWLSSNDVKSVPPDALFYNLFCCSSLRFTTNNFLGAAYLFNSSNTSLVTIGSTKTGSMLVFSAFYSPLGQGKSVGQAFKEWFNALAPYSDNEISWHYGMTIIGDPLVTPCVKTDLDLVQVLDRSGSMNSTASDVSSDTKIEVLRFAADEFIQMMKPNIGNRLGLVQFNQDTISFAPTYDTELQELITTPIDHVTHLRNAVNSIIASGWTSIGDGLHQAREQFNAHGDPSNDHFILLVTDGKENREMWISGIQPDLTDDNIIVHALGLGHGGGIDEVKLTNLAFATGGTYRITSDPLEFRKFFIEILAGAVNWAVIVDPIGELASGEVITVPVTITADQIGATFTAYWEGIDYAVDLRLITPSGKEITPGDTSVVRYVNHPRYVFYQLDFPLSGYLSGEWAGKWKMKLSGTTRIRTGKVRYSCSAFAEGGAKIVSGFDKLYNLTGDRIRAWVKFAVPSFPLPPPAPKIIAYCDKPLEGVGNVLHAFKYDPAKLQPTDSLTDYDPITHKLDILRQQTGEEILPRGATELVLYDDGAHDDGAAGDGLYANSFTDTKIQGSYTFRFVASDIPSGSGLKTTREWTKSFYNQVDIDPKHSDINITLLAKTADGNRYSVKIVPKDRFNNYLGPGHPVLAFISHPNGVRQILLTDNIDGTYTKEILITQSEINAGAKLEIDIDGKRFTTAKLEPKLRRFSISLHSGIAIPIDNFADDFEQGYNVLVDLDYHFTQQLSFVGFFGYNDFKSKTAGIDDNYWMNVSANIKYREPLRPRLFFYFNGGPGYYIPETGDSRFGLNLGAGFNYDYTNTINFELGADYHTIFDQGIQFVHGHAGLILRF
ncbi:VWA domain-containing protein [candidate division WOR-3 bacterium]|nr:VWA domain-containing protein [candidate division WOR-3 bacterium]